MYYSLHDIEKKQNVRLPEKYKQLYQSALQHNYGRLIIKVGDERFNIKKFLSIKEIINVLDEFYDFWGYDIVPIAEVEYGDYICLHYKECRNVPTIVYWNYELALENPNECILFLYKNIETFEMELKELMKLSEL